MMSLLTKCLRILHGNCTTGITVSCGSFRLMRFSASNIFLLLQKEINSYIPFLQQSSGLWGRPAINFFLIQSPALPAIKKGRLSKRILRCDLRVYETLSELVLGKHRKFHVKKLKYKCELCSYSVSDQKRLTHHLKYHNFEVLICLY